MTYILLKAPLNSNQPTIKKMNNVTVISLSRPPKVWQSQFDKVKVVKNIKVKQQCVTVKVRDCFDRLTSRRTLSSVMSESLSRSSKVCERMWRVNDKFWRVLFKRKSSLVCQVAGVDQVVEDYSLLAAEVLRFSNSIPPTATTGSGRTLTEGNVSNIVGSEQAPVIWSTSCKRDQRLRSSSEDIEEHHPTLMCDQSTQVNYYIRSHSACLLFQPSDPLHFWNRSHRERKTVKFQMLWRSWICMI